MRRASWNSSPPNTPLPPLFPARGTCNVPDSSRRAWWRRARTSRPGPSRRRWQTTSTTCWLALFLSPLPTPTFYFSLNGAGSRLVPKNLEGRPAQHRICTCRDAIRRTIFSRKSPIPFGKVGDDSVRGGEGATRLTSKPATNFAECLLLAAPSSRHHVGSASISRHPPIGGGTLAAPPFGRPRGLRRRKKKSTTSSPPSPVPPATVVDSREGHVDDHHGHHGA